MRKSSTTSSEVKERYNEKTYHNLRIRIRKDSPFLNQIKDFAKRKKLNALVNTLLEKHLTQG